MFRVCSYDVFCDWVFRGTVTLAFDLCCDLHLCPKLKIIFRLHDLQSTILPDLNFLQLAIPSPCKPVYLFHIWPFSEPDRKLCVTSATFTSVFGFVSPFDLVKGSHETDRQWLVAVCVASWRKDPIVMMHVCILHQSSVDGDADAAVESRIRIGWNKFRQLAPLLTNRDISLIRRGRLYSSCVRSSMLHGSETWPVRKENKVALQQAEMRMVRWMCDVKVKDKVPSKELTERLGIVLPSVLWHSWLGHLTRKTHPRYDL